MLELLLFFWKPESVFLLRSSSCVNLSWIYISLSLWLRLCFIFLYKYPELINFFLFLLVLLWNFFVCLIYTKLLKSPSSTFLPACYRSSWGFFFFCFGWVCCELLFFSFILFGCRENRGNEKSKKEKEKKVKLILYQLFFIYFFRKTQLMQKKKAVEFDKFYYFSKVIVLIIILLSHHICVMFKPWSLFVVFCSKLSYLGYSFYYYYYDFNFLFVIKSAKGFSFLDLVITVSR